MQPPTDRRRAALDELTPAVRPDAPSTVRLPVTDWGARLDAARGILDPVLRDRATYAVAIEMYTACCALRAQVDMRGG